jgi:uncharacterized membrane protein
MNSKSRKYFRNFLSALLVGIMLFFVFMMGQITLPYFTFRYDVNFLLTKQNVIHIFIWRCAFYTHISSSIFVLFTGIFQFIKPILRNRPKLHRMLGKIYVFLVLFISAPSGFIMAIFANGGVLAKISFAVISILWWVFTFRAYQFVRRKNFKLHLAYMYRSYALTLTAITLRTYVLILPHFIHLHAKEMYTLVAYLSWIPNLIIAELLIRKWKLKGSLIPSH